jgi:hypothetical protein
VLPGEVELHVPEAVDVETTSSDAPVGDLGLGHLDPRERQDLDRRPQLLDRQPLRQMGRRRRKDVTPVERRRDRLERVFTVRDLMRGLDPTELLRRRHEQPIVRPDVETPVAAPQRDLPAVTADAGIDDREVHAFGEVRQRVREHDRALEHLVRLDPVRDVDDLDLGRDPPHHAVADADEVVLEPEVGQERDQHVRPKLIDPRPR